MKTLQATLAIKILIYKYYIYERYYSGCKTLAKKYKKNLRWNRDIFPLILVFLKQNCLLQNWVDLFDKAPINHL